MYFKYNNFIYICNNFINKFFKNNFFKTIFLKLMKYIMKLFF